MTSTSYDAHNPPTDSMLKVNPQRQRDLLEAVKAVTSRINRTLASTNRQRQVRLLAVSKLKPPSDILALHTIPQTGHPDLVRGIENARGLEHFGENYLQELQSKAAALPKSIKWHFVGGLQSNKSKSLGETEGLWCVSSVDSAKKADGLEKGRKALIERWKEADGAVGGEAREHERLRVHVQVNTSGEESKSGVEPDAALELCKHIIGSCPHLKLAGFMTIGAIARSQATTPETENEDFIKLRDVRDRVAGSLGWENDKLDLSMGMSDDFESAIRCGSDEVRVGSTIFGERAAKGSRVPDERGEKAKEGVEEGKG